MVTLEVFDHMRSVLLANGWTVGERDPRVNTNYPGRFMAIEPHEDSELPTEDGRNGPWAIVGDDLDELTRKAYDFFCGMCSSDN